jgi:uncharacterized protein YeaO (DUF488 family)
MLRTKSILSPREELDGLRVSVMSRHTLNDGVTLHPEIDSSSYDEWVSSLSPPLKLLGDYYKRGLSWDEFELKYLGYLRQAGVQGEVKSLAQKSTNSTITLLCIEESPERCHRRVLAEECKRYEPSLEVNIG